MSRVPKNKFLAKAKKSTFYLSKVANDNHGPHKNILWWVVSVAVIALVIISLVV